MITEYARTRELSSIYTVNANFVQGNAELPITASLISPTVLILPECRAAALSLNLLAAVEVPLVHYDTDNII